tara:strand:- start:1075 stop:1407 length:333 start_codon:yes stop_codon:yes gene_type:complete
MIVRKKDNTCEWCFSKTSMGKTTQAETPILEFIEDKINELGREEVWGVNGDWSLMDLDSDLEAELLVYDELLNNLGKRVVCWPCLEEDDKLYEKYYGDMLGGMEIEFEFE